MEHHFVFRQNTIDQQIFEHINIHNEYRLPDVLLPDDIIIDIGAHIGSFSYAALQRGSNYVYGFEAERSNYECALHNLRFFNDRAKIAHKAVWRSDQVVERLRFAGSADSANTSGGGVLWSGAAGTPIEAISLDDILRDITDNGRKRVRLLKIDCEGAEFPILLTSNMLSVIDSIYGEFHEAGGHYDQGTIPDHAQVPGFERFTIVELGDTLDQAGFNVSFTRHPGSHMGLFFAQREPINKILDGGQALAFSSQNELIVHLQQMLHQRDQHIADLEARARWLNEQSQAAHKALAAVENGRLMRILRWLTKT
jgi:FkbM family methyltransferase